MCTVKNPSGCTMATIPRCDSLYHIVTGKSTQTDQANIPSINMSISEAHHKLRHIAHSAIHIICSNPEFNYWHRPGSWLKTQFGKPCAKAKSARQPFPKESQTWTTKYGERVHWDLWGLASVKNLNGNYYVAACIDDATCENKFYFQEKKSETCDSYKWDDALIETQSGNHINISHSDWVGEFLSKELIQHQDSKGTVHELTVHNSPQQNGVSEHDKHTWAECAWALLLASGLPRYLWEEAMKHSTWLQERTPVCALNGKTPYEMKDKKKPHLASIYEFSAAAYVKDLKAGKLDAHAQIGWLLVMTQNLMGTVSTGPTSDQ